MTDAAESGGLTPGREVVVSATELDETGAGICPLDPAGHAGHPVEEMLHVAGALPGESVRASVEHLSPHRGAGGGRRAFGRVLEVLAASPDRVRPTCPGHGDCGGCPVQHLRYSAQLAWKESRVRATLAAHPALAGATVLPAVGSPRELRYRNQAKYVYGLTAEGKLTLGAYAPRTHRLVDLLGCAVVEPPIDEVARLLTERLVARKVVPFDEVRRTGVLRYVILRATAAGEVLCVLVTGGRRLPEGAALAEELRAGAPMVAGVVENVNPTSGNVLLGDEEHLLGGRASLREEVAGVTVRLGSRSFLQLNRQVAGLAYGRIREAAGNTGTLGRVVDLYAGVGSISFALRDLAPELVAVEENPAATDAGAGAASAAGVKGLRFVTGAAAAATGLLPGADLIVLNPPRAGAAAIAPAVATAGARSVIYLSCNPSTLARDLATLLAPGKLHLVSVEPFDMLPHTPHVEALAVLRGHSQP